LSVALLYINSFFSIAADKEVLSTSNW